MTSIAFVVPEMLPVPPVQGGAVEGWVHEVSCELALRGFEVAVVSRPADLPAAPRRGADLVRHVGVAWSRLGRRLCERRRGWSARHPLRPLVKAANVLEYAVGVRRALKALDPDIVYVHNDPYLASLLPVQAGRALVLHMHNDHLSGPAPARLLLSRTIARCERVLCVSDFIRDRARRACPRHADRFQTVLNAIDVGHLAPGEPLPGPAGQAQAARFLYVGRLVPQKGVNVLLDAFARLLPALPGAELTIAGSSFFAGAPRTACELALRRQAQPLGDAVKFTGFVPHSQLGALYRRADVVVVPSTWDEPFGLVVLEAMACGACVVASAVGGIPELVDHARTGWLVEPDDAAGLSDAMLRLARDPALRRRLGAAARREAVQRFDLPRLVDDLVACFDALRPPSRHGAPARLPLGVGGR